MVTTVGKSGTSSGGFGNTNVNVNANQFQTNILDMDSSPSNNDFAKSFAKNETDLRTYFIIIFSFS